MHLTQIIWTVSLPHKNLQQPEKNGLCSCLCSFDIHNWCRANTTNRYAMWGRCSDDVWQMTGRFEVDSYFQTWMLSYSASLNIYFWNKHTSYGSNQKFEYLKSKRAMKSDSTIPKQIDSLESTEPAISNKRKALPNRLFVKNLFSNMKTRCLLITCPVYYFLLSISCFLGFNKLCFKTTSCVLFH